MLEKFKFNSYLFTLILICSKRCSKNLTWRCPLFQRKWPGANSDYGVPWSMSVVRLNLVRRPHFCRLAMSWMGHTANFLHHGSSWTYVLPSISKLSESTTGTEHMYDPKGSKKIPVSVYSLMKISEIHTSHIEIMSITYIMSSSSVTNPNLTKVVNVHRQEHPLL